MGTCTVAGAAAGVAGAGATGAGVSDPGFPACNTASGAVFHFSLHDIKIMRWMTEKFTVGRELERLVQQVQQVQRAGPLEQLGQQERLVELEESA